MQCFGNTGIYPAIFQIQNEEIILNFLATFFCFFAFGRILDSKAQYRSPEVIFHRFGISICWA